MTDNRLKEAKSVQTQRKFIRASFSEIAMAAIDENINTFHD